MPRNGAATCYAPHPEHPGLLAGISEELNLTHDTHHKLRRTVELALTAPPRYFQGGSIKFIHAILHVCSCVSESQFTALPFPLQEVAPGIFFKPVWILLRALTVPRASEILLPDASGPNPTSISHAFL